MTMDVSFGEKIKWLREDRNLSRSQLGGTAPLGGLTVAQHDDYNRGADGALTVRDLYDRLILNKP